MTTLFLTLAAKKFVSPKVIDFIGCKFQTPEEDPVHTDIDEDVKFGDVADMHVDDTQNDVAENDSADDDDGNSSQFSKFYY